MTAAIELPEEYARNQDLLPEFDVVVNLVLSRLSLAYEYFIEKGGTSHSDRIIKVWLEEYNGTCNYNDELMTYYDTLRSIIDDELNKTGVSYDNEEFLLKVQEECENYGYESWENPDEIIVEMTYAVRSLLIDEIQECVEFLDTSELVARINN